MAMQFSVVSKGAEGYDTRRRRGCRAQKWIERVREYVDFPLKTAHFCRLADCLGRLNDELVTLLGRAKGRTSEFAMGHGETRGKG